MKRQIASKRLWTAAAIAGAAVALYSAAIAPSRQAAAQVDRVSTLLEACGKMKGGVVEHMTLQTFDTDQTRELVRIGRPAVPQLTAALADGNKHIRRHAALVLGEIGDPVAVESLLECCRAEHARNAESGEWDNDVLEPATVAVVKLLFPEHAEDHNWLFERKNLVDVVTRGGYLYEWDRKPELSAFWKEYRKAHPTVFTAFEDLDEEFREAVKKAGWKSLPADAHALVEKRIASDPNREPYARMDALALATPGLVGGLSIGNYAEPERWRKTANTLLSEDETAAYQRHRHELVVGTVARGAAVVPELLPSAFPRPEEYPRHDLARELLPEIGAKALPILKDALKPPKRHDPYVLWSFIAAVPGPEAETMLREGLADENLLVRDTTFLCLQKRGDKIDVPTALAALDSESPAVLDAAIEILVQSHERRALDPLQAVIAKYDNPESLPERRASAQKAKQAVETIKTGGSLVTNSTLPNSQ